VATQGETTWSSDGKWNAVSGRDSNGPGLFKIAADGGATVRLVSGVVSNPVWSPDGTLVVYSGPQVGPFTRLMGVRPDGSPVALPPTRLERDEGTRFRFMPDSKRIVYLAADKSASNFWMLDLTTDVVRQLTHFTDLSGITAFDIAQDGKSIVFDRVRENSDIVLIDLPK
jgi:Tol biopolymer transport system component